VLSLPWKKHYKRPVQGSHREDERTTKRIVVGFERDTGRLVRWAGQPATPFQESTLSTRETSLLDLMRSRIGKPTTVEQLLELSAAGPEETLQALDTLISAGVLEVEPEPEAGSEKDDLSGTRAGPQGPSSVRALFPRGVIPEKLGRFEVQEIIGQGSMGAVLLARDPAIDRPVAIKLIQTATHLMPAQQEKYRERFYREASAAGQLQHHSIATVYDVGHTDDGTPFIVMEYLKGKTLRELIEEHRLTVDQALKIARDVLDALSYAHEQGIVHRDIKPGNILVTSDFHGKIMDFGIAHVVGSELTTGDDVLGSPYYMAPEQLSKAKVDQRTDLFSFSVVLYRMLTGRLPFTGDSFAAIAHSILNETPVSPDRLDPSVGPDLAAIVLQGLSKRSEERFESASAMSRALYEYERGVLPETRRPDGRDMWLSVAIALLIGALLVFRLVLSGPQTGEAPVEDTPATSATAVSGPDRPEPASAAPDEPSQPPVESAHEAEPTMAVSVSPRSRHQVTTESNVPRTRPRPAAAPQPRRAEPELPPRETATPPEAELFYEARMALERGELEKSQALLEQLYRVDPTFAGASELHLDVTDRIWQRSLPLVFGARHKHRIGGCDGELSLATIGVRFRSGSHDWAWEAEDIRVIEHPEARILYLETFEKDLLSLGKNKGYRFELDGPLGDDDWTRYQRLLRK
jgi:serine/threonine protein kinase